MPRISHIFCSVFACGSPIPFSYFETDERSISSISASCCCVSPLFFLASLKFSEKLICKFPHKIKSAQPKPRTKNTRLDCCDTNLTSQKRRMWKSRYFYTKKLYHLYNKNPVFFHFVQKFHEITIALIHSSEKNQACFVNQGRLVLFYLRTMSPFSTSTVIDVTGVSILSMIFSAILSSTLRRILFLRSLAPLVPPTDSFASSATASSV